jgi:hypothetical protein
MSDPPPNAPLPRTEPDPGYVVCDECGGEGRCLDCRGTGRRQDGRQCPFCIGRMFCPVCKGSGQRRKRDDEP